MNIHEIKLDGASRCIECYVTAMLYYYWLATPHGITRYTLGIIFFNLLSFFWTTPVLRRIKQKNTIRIGGVILELFWDIDWPGELRTT